MPEAALFSLSDRTGAAEVARALAERGHEIYATGGTRDALAADGIAARDVEEITGFPPLFRGRVKTLHPKILGAILFDRGDEGHRAQARTYAIHAFSTVVVNLYPLPEIDIGGVALLRAAAKNYPHVSILSNP